MPGIENNLRFLKQTIMKINDENNQPKHIADLILSLIESQ